MKWVSVFKYLSIEYGENIAFAMDQTQRVSFESNADGDKPGFMKSAYHLGDGLHPGNAGGRKMAECVDLQAVLRR
ncbi:MAG: hypothetical protein IKN97_03005 [Lachnospiraceae bacterium]|nr:hypothetical protein [Lachnospiraceae bacterium]